MDKSDSLDNRIKYFLLARFSRMQVAYIYAVVILVFLALCLAAMIVIVLFITTYVECLTLLAIAVGISLAAFFTHTIADLIVDRLPTRKPHEDEKAKHESP